MKKILFSILLLSLAVKVSAQQIPFYCQYYINPFVYNPANTGNTETWNTFLIHRSQWSGFPGAPVTSAITIDGPIKDKKIGVGLSVFNDVIGITRKLGVYGTYSYRMNLSERQRVYLGLSIGVVDNKIDFSKQIVKDFNEASLENQYDNKTSPDASFGAKYEIGNFEAGFAIPQILGGTLSYVNMVDSRSYYNLYRHYLGTIKYRFPMNKEKEIYIYPLFLARYTPSVPFQYDANIVCDWKKVGWLAVSYKNEYAVALNAGVRLNGLSIGYVYDFITSPIGAYAGNSSEILIGYSFKLDKKQVDNKYDEKLVLLSKKLKQLQDQNKKDKQEIDTLKSKLKSIEFDKNMIPQEGRTYVLSSVHFATKKYDLNKESKHILKDLADFLQENPDIKIEIHGHTDDVGTEENNEKLSENRAKAVYDYLIEKGVDSSRLSYKAFGESQPIVPGITPKARALNRRTEFIILSK